MRFGNMLVGALLMLGVFQASYAQEKNANGKSYTGNYYYANVNEDELREKTNFQTSRMKTLLALNDVQTKAVSDINFRHAREVEVAKTDCGDDLTGFNSQVDKIEFARDYELKRALTPDQYALYVSKKSDDTWLGLSKFKVKSAKNDDYKVKLEKRELKIKGKVDEAGTDLSASGKTAPAPGSSRDISSDAYRNENNIQAAPEDTMGKYRNIPQDDAMSPGFGDVAPKNNDQSENATSDNGQSQNMINEYEESSQSQDYASAKVNNVQPENAGSESETGRAYKVRPEYDSTDVGSASGSSSKVCKDQAGKKRKVSKVKSKSSVSSSKSKSKSGSKSAKKSNAVEQGAASSQTENQSSFSNAGSGDTSAYEGLTDTSARVGKPLNLDTTASANPYDGTYNYNEKSYKEQGNGGQTQKKSGAAGSVYENEQADSTASSSARTGTNYFKNKDSKGKFTPNETKIKPTDNSKIKSSKKETKIKEESGDKIKANDDESKLKYSDGTKAKSNENETKYKDTKDGKVKSNENATKVKGNHDKVKDENKEVKVKNNDVKIKAKK